MAHQVFICHSSRDKAVADAVCAALESEGIACWIAPRDVLAGVEYGKAIMEALTDCQIVLLIFSQKANDSPQVRREIERAVSKEKIILPFRIEDVLPSNAMEYALGNTHWLDALTPPVERHVPGVCRTVSRILNRQGISRPIAQSEGPVFKAAAGAETRDLENVSDGAKEVTTTFLGRRGLWRKFKALELHNQVFLVVGTLGLIPGAWIYHLIADQPELIVTDTSIEEEPGQYPVFHVAIGNVGKRVSEGMTFFGGTDVIARPAGFSTSAFNTYAANDLKEGGGNYQYGTEVYPEKQTEQIFEADQKISAADHNALLADNLRIYLVMTVTYHTFLWKKATLPVCIYATGPMNQKPESKAEVRKCPVIPSG